MSTRSEDMSELLDDSKAANTALKMFEQLMLSLAGADREDMKKSIEKDRREVEQKFAPILQTLENHLAKTKEPAYRMEHVLKCNKLYPDLIRNEVEKQLLVHSKADIQMALINLYHLRERGVGEVWDKIKPELKKITQRKFGTIFTDKDVDAGKVMPLDIEYFGLFVAKQIAEVSVDPSNQKQVIRALKISGTDLSFFPGSPKSTWADDVQPIAEKHFQKS